jgi:hypothetical protein
MFIDGADHHHPLFILFPTTANSSTLSSVPVGNTCGLHKTIEQHLAIVVNEKYTFIQKVVSFEQHYPVRLCRSNNIYYGSD